MSAFTEMIDLASARLGGEAVIANDEFFAPKENLLLPGRGVFIEDKYTERGKWMDGWETRRRREPGHDWCIIRLGLPGVVRGVEVDTNHFRGNFPEACSIDACAIDRDVSGETLLDPSTQWVEALAKSRLEGHSQNLFPIALGSRVTHLRLNIFPDGGVARLRVYGEATPDWARLRRLGEDVDLVAAQNGGLPIACSDKFFSHPTNLIMPGRAVNMGDGWETKRRRGPGYDWVILRMGARGEVARIEVDTNHFKGNYPDRCMIECCDAAGGVGAPVESLHGARWKTLLAETRLKASTRHFFDSQLQKAGACTHIRLNIYPDGGVSRLRIWGRPGAEGGAA
jgi:allantoicase